MCEGGAIIIPSEGQPSWHGPASSPEVELPLLLNLEANLDVAQNSQVHLPGGPKTEKKVTHLPTPASLLPSFKQRKAHLPFSFLYSAALTQRATFPGRGRVSEVGQLCDIHLEVTVLSSTEKPSPSPLKNMPSNTLGEN